MDVGLFGPLSTYYSVELNRLINITIGFTTIDKHSFFKVFKTAFDQAFTKEAIQHTFQKPSIWPINHKPMIDKVTRAPLPLL